MISPIEAQARRQVRTSDKYKQCERELDALLCGPPNHGTTWQYEMPALRDAGALHRALAEDYERAGWRTRCESGNSLVIWDESVHVKQDVCARCRHEPRPRGVACTHESYNPSTHESVVCGCRVD